MEKTNQKLSELEKRFHSLAANVDLGEKRNQIAKLEGESGKAEFWQDQEEAGRVMKELSSLKEEVEEVERFQKSIDDLKAMVELGIEEDFEREVARVEKGIEKAELRNFLSGPYDHHDAILTIYAGQGGVEAMDWAQMLERMYVRFIEKKGWKMGVIDSVAGEEAGIKSVTLSVDGSYAYGYLRGEAGAHRLVRQSPFNADQLRQTSFAQVEVLPKIEKLEEGEIKDDDLEWQFFRASTQGGQNVQKVSSAVRVKHKPTGVVVTCQQERTQEQNRKIALSLLGAKLWARRQEEDRQQEKKLKGEYKIAGWGNQIRSYVLHPYKMVKDLRTGVKVEDPDRVLAGDLDLFIDANLKLLVR